MVRTDPALSGRVRELITTEHINAEWALKTALLEIEKSFESIGDEYIKSRVADTTFVGERLLRNLIGKKTSRCHLLDNSIIAMTGGQPTMATDEEVVDLVAGLGVPRGHIRIVEPTAHKKAHTLHVIREELAYTGLSVIVARRACVTYAKEIKEIKSHKREIPVVAA